MVINSVVITGATSSIGCALIKKCIEKNIEVLALANRNSKHLEWIPRGKNVNILECGLDELESCITQLDSEKYDAFFHLAWASSRGDLARGKLLPQVDNIKYSLQAVDLAEKLGCKVFLGAGSQAEFGRTEAVLDENVSTNPETPYGIAKLAAGQMTRVSCMEKGIKHIWPRILSTYGPKYLPETVVNYTIIELLKGAIPRLTKGEQIWDFMYNEDAAEALLLLAKYGRDGETYVVGSGISRPLCEYIVMIRDSINKNLVLGLGDKPYAQNSVMHLSCNIEKLCRDTGFIPRTTFEVGISKTIDWIRNESGYVEKEN